MRPFFAALAMTFLAFLPACFDDGERGPMGPAGQPGQDALLHSYVHTYLVPDASESYLLPAWTATGDVFVAADVWLHSADFSGWSPINVIWNDGYDFQQAAMLVKLPTVEILNCQGQKIRIRAWEFAE